MYCGLLIVLVPLHSIHTDIELFVDGIVVSCSPKYLLIGAHRIRFNYPSNKT